jgi:hypothetical protein
MIVEIRAGFSINGLLPKYDLPVRRWDRGGDAAPSEKNAREISVGEAFSS